MKKLTALGALLLALWAAPVLAGGIYTGLPAAGNTANTWPLSGNERIGADTLLPGGQPPQTEAITTAQLVAYAQSQVPWVLTTTSTATAGIVEPFIASTMEVNPQSSSTAIYANGAFMADYPSTAAAITGGGHIIGAIGWITNHNTAHALPLAIGIEGKIENDAAGTITSAIPFDANIAANPAGATITNAFGGYVDVASNAGTIGIVAGSTVQVDGNTGTISAIAASYLPTLNSNSGTISAAYGLYCATQSVTIASQFCLVNLNSSAPIYSVAAIITTSAVEAPVVIATGTPPSVAGSGGTCAATSPPAGGASVGAITLTGACAATDTLALTGMPTEPTGYVCDATDRNAAATVVTESATTTTGVTLKFSGSTSGATDVIQFKCLGY